MFAFGEIPKSGEPEIGRTAFERLGQEYCLSPAYRTPVRFLAQDIRQDIPDGRFDLVFCRNLVFTYFESAVRNAISLGGDADTMACVAGGIA